MFYRYTDDTEVGEIKKNNRIGPAPNQTCKWFTPDRYDTGEEAQKFLAMRYIPTHRVGPIPSDELPDFDHIPHVKKAIRSGRFGVESRSPLHELVGLVFISLGALVVGVIDPHLSLLGFSCGLSHFAIDFLTRPSRPLYPFSSKKVDLRLYPEGLKDMFVWDTILTAALGLVYVIARTV